MRWIDKRKAFWLWMGYTAVAMLTGMLLTLAAQRWLPMEQRPETAAAFAAMEDAVLDNLFAPEWTAAPIETPAVPSDAPQASATIDLVQPPTTSPADGGFRIEVIREEPVAAAQGKRILIYHTHTYEAYEQQPDRPYVETQTWRTADEEHNMVRVGKELQRLLTAKGYVVVHDTTAFEPPKLSSAYTRSLNMLERRRDAGEHYDLYIDLHRDAYVASQKGSNTVQTAAGACARLMMLIGKGEGQTEQGFDQKPEWEKNLAIAQQLTEALRSQEEGLCKEVCLKSGRFNQHIAPCCVLIEVGNNRNTLDEALASMPYLADAIASLP